MDKQIDKEHFMPIAYFKSQAFTGSLNGMRYMVRKGTKTTTNENGEETSVDILEAYIWPEPFSFDHTEDNLKTRMEFEYSPDGISDAVDWINNERTLWED